MKRRDFLAASGLCCLADLARAMPFQLDEGGTLMNPCQSGLPEALRTHELVRAAWEGLDPSIVWDVHAHLLGDGKSGSGCWISPKMRSILYPHQFIQRKFFENAACAFEDDGGLDDSYLARLAYLVNELPAGARMMLLAFDYTHLGNGSKATSSAAFHVPDRYALNIAKRFPTRFQAVASVHPYRADALDALAYARREGAMAVKWLPSAMGIDPGSAECDKFYEALVKHKLPLLTHAGQERAVKGAHEQHFGNPLRLRRALDHGVTVIVAHCASMGQDRDIDKGPNGPYVDCFDLFSRLMEEPRYEQNLRADISATPQTNRVPLLEKIVQREHWHARLLNGTDYPLPGVMPLFSVDGIVARGWLTSREGAVIKQIREYNPLLFDFVLKRSIRVKGKRLGNPVFETARHFVPATA
jgi:mannonate dehydratase